MNIVNILIESIYRWTIEFIINGHYNGYLFSVLILHWKVLLFQIQKKGTDEIPFFVYCSTNVMMLLGIRRTLPSLVPTR